MVEDEDAMTHHDHDPDHDPDVEKVAARRQRRERRSVVIEKHTSQEALGVRVELFVLQPLFTPLAQSARPVGTPTTLPIANKDDGKDDLRVSPGIEHALTTYVVPENRSTKSLQYAPVALIEDDEDAESDDAIRAGLSADTERKSDDDDDDSSSSDLSDDSETDDEDGLDEHVLAGFRLRVSTAEKVLFQDTTGKLTFRSLPGGFVASATGALRFHSPQSLKRALLVETNLHRDVPAAAAVAASGKPTRLSPSFRSIDRLVQQTALCSLQATPSGETLLLSLDSHAAMLSMISEWIEKWPERVARKLQHHVEAVAPTISGKRKGAHTAQALHTLWELALQPENHECIAQNAHQLPAAALGIVDGVLPFCGHGPRELQQSVHFMATGLLGALLAHPATRASMLARPHLTETLARSLLVSLQRIPSHHLDSDHPAPILVLTIKALALLSHEGKKLHDTILDSDKHVDILLTVADKCGDIAAAERALELLVRAIASSTLLERHQRVFDLVCRRAFARNREVSLRTRAVVTRAGFMFFRSARHKTCGFEPATWDAAVDALEASLAAFRRLIRRKRTEFRVNMVSWNARRAHIRAITSSAEVAAATVVEVDSGDEVDDDNDGNVFSREDVGKTRSSRRDRDDSGTDVRQLEPVLDTQYAALKRLVVFATAMLAAALENILARRDMRLPQHVAERVLHSLTHVLLVIEEVKYADVAGIDEDEDARQDHENPDARAHEEVEPSSHQKGDRRARALDKDLTFRKLEVLALAALVDLAAGRCETFLSTAVQHAAKLWDCFTVKSIRKRHSHSAQILQARLLHTIAQHAPAPQDVVETIFESVLLCCPQDAKATEHPMPLAARRYLAGVWALSCRSGEISMARYLGMVRTFMEANDPRCSDAVIEVTLFGAFPLVVHAVGGLRNRDLHDQDLDRTLDLLVEHGAKRAQTATPLLRGLQRLLRGALDALASAPAAEGAASDANADAVPAVDRSVRICVKLLLRGSRASSHAAMPEAEADLLEAALHVLWIVSSSSSPLAHSKSLFHAQTVRAIHAAVQSDSEVHRNIPRFSGRVLLALATRNPEIVIAPLAAAALSAAAEPGGRHEGLDAQTPIEIKAALASKVLLRSSTPELISCGAYLLSTYRLSVDQHKLIRDAGCLESLMRLVVDKDRDVDETSKSLALVSLSRITAHDRANQRAVAAFRGLLPALEDILLRAEDSPTVATHRQLAGAALRNLLKHAANRPAIYKLELRLRQASASLPEVCAARGGQRARRKTLPLRRTRKEKFRDSYDAWLDDMERSCSKLGRLATKTSLLNNPPHQDATRAQAKRPVPLLTKNLCKPVSSLWHSASDPGLKADPWSPKHLEATQEAYGISISIDFDRFFFPDYDKIHATTDDAPGTMMSGSSRERADRQNKAESGMPPGDDDLQKPASREQHQQHHDRDAAQDPHRVSMRDYVKRQMLANFKRVTAPESEAGASDEGSEDGPALESLSGWHAPLGSRRAPGTAAAGGKNLVDGVADPICKSHLAIFAHIEGGRVYKDLPHFELPDGTKSHVYYQASHVETSGLLVVMVPPPPAQRVPDPGKELPSLTHEPTAQILDESFAFFEAMAQRASAADCDQDCNPMLPPTYSLARARGCRHATSGVGWTQYGVLFDDALPLLLALPHQRDGSRRSSSFLGLVSGRCERLGTFAYRQLPASAPAENIEDRTFDLASSVFADPSMPKTDTCLPACRRVLNDKSQFARLASRDVDLSPDCAANIWASIEKRFDLLCGIFLHYGCVLGNSNHAFSMQLNQFTLFLRDTGFLRARAEKCASLKMKPGAAPLASRAEAEPIICTVNDVAYQIHPMDTSASDTIFIIVNKTLPETMLEKLQSMTKGSRVFQVKRDETMLLYEFIDSLVRIADITVCQPSSQKRRSKDADEAQERIPLDQAVEAILQRVVDLYMHERILLMDVFRVDRMHNWAVNSILSENLSMFRKLFNHYTCVCGELSRGYGAARAERLGLVDWITLVDDLGLFSPLFTKRDASWVFVSSASQRVDPFKHWTRAVALNFPQFLECMCRLADAIFVPTDAQLKTVGVLRENSAAGFGDADFDLAPAGIVGFYRLMQQTTLWNTFERPVYMVNACHLLRKPMAVPSAPLDGPNAIETSSETHGDPQDVSGTESIVEDEGTVREVEDGGGLGTENPTKAQDGQPTDDEFDDDKTNVETDAASEEVLDVTPFYDDRALDYKLVQLIKIVLATEVRRSSKVSTKTAWIKFARRADLDEKKAFKKLLAEQVVLDSVDESTPASSEPDTLAPLETELDSSSSTPVVPLQGVGRRLTLDIRVAQELAASHVQPRSALANDCEGTMGEDSEAGVEALATLPAPVKRDLLITAHQACEMVRSTAAGRSKDDLSLRETLFSKAYVESSSRRLVQLRAKRIPQTKKFDALSSVEQQSYMAIVQRAVREFLFSPLE